MMEEKKAEAQVEEKVIKLTAQIEITYAHSSDIVEETYPYKLETIILCPLEPCEEVVEKLTRLGLPFEIGEYFCFTKTLDKNFFCPKKSKLKKLNCCFYTGKIIGSTLSKSVEKKDLEKLWHKFCEEEFESVFHDCNLKTDSDGDSHGDFGFMVNLEVDNFNGSDFSINLEKMTLFKTAF
jgi:hypothetical protein